MSEWWSGEEKPTGRLRIKMPENARHNAVIQQEWVIVTIDHVRSVEWRKLPVVPFDTPDEE